MSTLPLDGAGNNKILSLPRAEYDRLTTRINWSRLKLIGKSPAHYREEVVNPSPDTDPRKRGRATHVSTFEPELFHQQYVVWEDRRAGKLWEAFKAEHESFGREILTQGMFEAATEIAKAARAHPLTQQYLAGGKGEQTMLWTMTAPALGQVEGYTFDCKGRPDFIANCGAIVDLKTTRSASADGFAREVLSYGYHAQAAFYVDGYRAITGKQLRYVFVAVEAAPPYAVTVFRVPDEILEMGRTKYRGYLDRLALCRATGEWPAYETAEVDLMLPPWAMPGGGDPTDLGLVIGDDA